MQNEPQALLSPWEMLTGHTIRIIYFKVLKEEKCDFFKNHVWVLGVPESEEFSAEKIFIEHLIQLPYFIDWKNQHKIILPKFTPIALWACPPSVGNILNWINQSMAPETLGKHGRVPGAYQVLSWNKSLFKNFKHEEKWKNSEVNIPYGPCLGEKKSNHKNKSTHVHRPWRAERSVTRGKYSKSHSQKERQQQPWGRADVSCPALETPT